MRNGGASIMPSPRDGSPRAAPQLFQALPERQVGG
jgi:hypothetical protein